MRDKTQKSIDRSDMDRDRFFEIQVYMESWIKSWTSKDEDKFLTAIESLGFRLGKDFVRQYPVAKRYVLDFAFVKEKIAVEIDGKSHLNKIQIKKDRTRDRYLYANGWITIRIAEDKFLGYKGLFWKRMIREVVEARRIDWESGEIVYEDFINFNESDYDYR